MCWVNSLSASRSISFRHSALRQRGDYDRRPILQGELHGSQAGSSRAGPRARWRSRACPARIPAGGAAAQAERAARQHDVVSVRSPRARAAPITVRAARTSSAAASARIDAPRRPREAAASTRTAKIATCCRGYSGRRAPDDLVGRSRPKCSRRAASSTVAGPRPSAPRNDVADRPFSDPESGSLVSDVPTPAAGAGDLSAPRCGPRRSSPVPHMSASPTRREEPATNATLASFWPARRAPGNRSA